MKIILFDKHKSPINISYGEEAYHETSECWSSVQWPGEWSGFYKTSFLIEALYLQAALLINYDQPR